MKRWIVTAAIILASAGKLSAQSPSQKLALLAPKLTNTGTVDTAALESTAVTPGTYTCSTVTVDAKGRITSASGGTCVLTGSITSSGLTMATARLLGRTTASTGAVEEITVGSGLSLAAGALTATGGSGVTSVATTSPITGGTITGTGTIACATCGVTGTGLSQFASTTSAELAAVLSNETGTGLAAFATAPSLTGPVTITEAVGSSALTLTGATQTSSLPVLNATQTWNAAGTTFSGWKMNVTNTASATASSLIDPQVAGTSLLTLRPVGPGTSTPLFGWNLTSNATGRRAFGFEGNGNAEVALKRYTDGWGAASANIIRWDNSINADTVRITTLDVATGLFFNNLSTAAFVSGGAGTIDMRALANAQTFNIYNTWTTAATNFEALRQSWISSVFHMGTTKGSSAGTARVMQFDYGGTTTAAISIPITSGPVTIDDPKVTTGVSNDGSGFKHSRVTTGSIAAGTTALVTVTWSTAFADANYTVLASVVDSTTTSLSLSVVHVESITASAVTVRVLNNALGALTGTLHVIAVHD